MLFSGAHAAWVGTYDILILSPFSRRNIKTACYMHTGVIEISTPRRNTMYSETSSLAGRSEGVSSLIALRALDTVLYKLQYYVIHY